MAEFLTLVQTDASLLPCQMRRVSPAAPLAGPASQPSGVGFFQSADVLLRKRPGSQKMDAASLTKDVASECLVVTAGPAAGGPFAEEGTLPFRFRRWLWAQAGAFEAIAPAQPKLVENVPEYLRRQISGSSPAEAVFFNFLSGLRASGGMDDLDLDPLTAARSMAEAVKALDKAMGDAAAGKPAPLTLCATNGRIVVAVRRGAGLHYALLEGLIPCELHNIGLDAAETKANVRAHRLLKAVALASTVEPGHGVAWMEVPDAHLVTVSRTLEVHVAPL